MDPTANRKYFLTPEEYAREQAQRMEPYRGQLILASCRSGTRLAEGVVGEYRRLLLAAGSSDEVPFLKDIDYNFSDTETGVRLDRHVGGSDVYLMQALYDPTCGRTIDQNYMAFLIAARTFKEHGANRVTAVLPYLAYARQDKPTKFQREPTTARLMADLSIRSGIDHMVCWNPHAGQIRGFYSGTSVHMLDPLNLFLGEFSRFRDQADTIAVAPDVGGSKLITHFSRELGLTSAIASKYRPQPEEARISEVIGHFGGKKRAIVLDDIVSSGGTVYALVRNLAEEQGIEEVYLGVSHNLCAEKGVERMAELHEGYHLKEMVVTDSVPQTDAFCSLPFVTVRSLAEILCRTINRLHYSRSVSEVFLHE
jgi:ribose-phosphate pyrophosphokinase